MSEKLKTIIAAAAAIAAMSALTGCSHAPGDAEVREAVAGRLSLLGKLDSEDSARIAKIKVIDCKKADAKSGFNCEWTGAEYFAGFVGNSGRIVKSDSGWVLASAGE